MADFNSFLPVNANVSLSASSSNIGSVSILGGIVNANVSLSASAAHIGSVSIFGTISTGMQTLFPGPNSIGSVTLNNSNANIGSVSVLGGQITANAGTNLNTSALALETGGNLDTLAGIDYMLGSDFVAPNVGNVTLNPSSSNIGSVSILGGISNANVSLGASNQYIGLTTAVIGNADAQAVPVYISGKTQTDEIIDYNTTAAVAAAGTANHDYVVNGGKTLLVRSIQASGSGKLKVALLGGTTVALGVQFNSSADPNTRFVFDIPYEEAATNTFRVQLTNRDSSAQDVYTTLIGEEV